MTHESTPMPTVTVEQRHIDLASACVPGALIFADEPEHIADARRRAAEHIARFDTERTAELERQNAALRDELDTRNEALGSIAQWAEAYPIDIFPEPDLDAVKNALSKAGITNHMDRMHASWARHITQGIGKIARNALGGRPT